MGGVKLCNIHVVAKFVAKINTEVPGSQDNERM